MANFVETYLFRDLTQVASGVFTFGRENTNLVSIGKCGLHRRLTGPIERILVRYTMPPEL